MGIKEVLSAPSSDANHRTLNLVILVVSIFSALGAGWIILSFFTFKALRTFRHQLILGLAISDFWMAINFLSSTAVNLSSPARRLGDRDLKGFCSFNGFMTQLFVVQTDYWVLLIAICTFLILADYKHHSSWIQDHRKILWFLPWFFSLLWAALGLGIVGYGDIGAWCWFTSDRTRLLVNFIPRWIIILSILALYTRLYFLIHKAHSRFMSFDEEASTGHLNSNNNGNSNSDSNSRGPGIRKTTEVQQTIELPYFSRKESQGTGDDTDRSAESSVQIISPPPPIPTHQRIGRSDRKLKKISYQMMTYPIIYMVIWTIPTTIRIYQATTGHGAPFGIATVDKACIVVQGFADAMIYGTNESTWRTWKTWFEERRN